ncbi:Fimbrial subunit type 1 [Microbacterium oxydans]|uniref:SpaH/EbpB family LPXTG-anchored major pilin n=1 Tax=Microbacterium oxydans TaxID=82380 RepID=UPI001D6C270B|nr:SpaH/EbpB family LPXTG-anchored major pilin [Microbacterium oxydans]CAH0240841.1 Fimbrial subunit type 1 [Microbacterium oxydans]
MAERKKTQRVLSLMGVTALGLGAVMSAGTAAYAAPQDYGNIDPDRTGSLTVHKYLHQAGDVEGDISQAPAAGDFTDPVAGVVFTAYPLLESGTPIDLSVPENWNDLSGLAAGAGCTAPAGYTLGAPIQLPATDAQGAASIELAIGVYQVCETAAPAIIVDRATPFILTVPMPHESGWVYDVHAYPKNGEGAIEKTVDPQQDTGLGAVVRFPVTVPVPTMQQQWTGFAIRDTLDDRLEPIAPADVEVTAGGTVLDPSFYEVTVVGQQVTMNFTAAGLAWLNEGPNAHVGTPIQVVFAGTVVAVGDGTISNQAELWPNNPGFDPDGQPPLPSNEVNTYWGNLEVQKRSAGTTGSEGRLNGATFEVYNAADPYADDCTAAVAAGDPVVVDGKTEFTSAGTGVISIAGLFVSDSVNPAIDATKRCYVLKEIAAPSGYVLPADPFTSVAVQVGATTTSDNVEIVNTQQEVPPLPLTGANGQLILITAGAGALIVAVGLLLMKHRRRVAAGE